MSAGEIGGNGWMVPGADAPPAAVAAPPAAPGAEASATALGLAARKSESAKESVKYYTMKILD